MKITINQLKKRPELINQQLTIKGWIRTLREQKTFAFLELNDGSCLSNLQVVVQDDLSIKGLTTGAAVAVTGLVVQSPGKNQSIELQAHHIKLIGSCPADVYPLQKKRHSFEFLRTIAHLRPRTNTLGAVTRVRNKLAFATHQFFQNEGFLYINTPIITCSDCEGAGELFRVTTIDPTSPPKNEEGQVDLSQDFFGQPAFLTVSGQLNAEIYASAFTDVYTFGPTFRAENSNTSRHLAEFWMIEPEIAFADLQDDMDLAQHYLQAIVKVVLDECSEDLDLFNRFISPGLLDRLQGLTTQPFTRVCYSDAVDILTKSKQTFSFPVQWGSDLQSEHERFLCENYFKGPVIVYNYPAQIKPFYMRLNDDEKTVANMDLLVPAIGELMGGSQREERLEILQRRMQHMGMDSTAYEWYLDLRRYGSTPHAGFGVGFERLVQMVTGMENIRDVIAFPRFPGHAAF